MLPFPPAPSSRVIPGCAETWHLGLLQSEPLEVCPWLQHLGFSLAVRRNENWRRESLLGLQLSSKESWALSRADAVGFSKSVSLLDLMWFKITTTNIRIKNWIHAF